MADDSKDKKYPPLPNQGQIFPGGSPPQQHKRPYSATSTGGIQSQAMRNHDFFSIHIGHIATGHDVSFEGWVTQFSDTYTSQWNEEQVYGRMDPLSTYQGTRRTIQLGFDVPNDSPSHAALNMERVQKLIQFMYPVYGGGTVQSHVAAAPLLSLRWTNLISSPSNPNRRLIGYINGGLAYNPEIVEGGFLSGEVVDYADPSRENLKKMMSDDVEGRFENNDLVVSADTKALRNYFPKKLSLSFSFTVVHTHQVGWSTSLSPDAAFVAAQASMTSGRSPYVFGGDMDTTRRFPNVYQAYPMPDDVATKREEVLDELVSEKENEEAANEMGADSDDEGLDGLTPRERRIQRRIDRRNAANDRDQELADNLAMTSGNT
tara:strand:- start:1092 stop:2216 length:1125 start_codon:yes stop_codon:yes gene_type:complete